MTIVNPAPPANETDILDTVVTVYDANMNQIAQDDDAYPRVNSDSQLFFEAPAAGMYYYTVDSCDTAVSGCGEMAAAVTDFRYQTFVADVNKLNHTEFYAGTMQDGTTAKAVPLTYVVTSNAASFINIDGDTFTAGKPQVFSFTVPASLTPMAGSRLRTELWLQPVGTANGDGSTSSVTMWVTDMTGTKILAQADQKNYKDGDTFTDRAARPLGPRDVGLAVLPLRAGRAPRRRPRRTTTSSWGPSRAATRSRSPGRPTSPPRRRRSSPRRRASRAPSSSTAA